MNQVELVKFCKELGCCDACCLRYLGLKTPSSYENVHRHILSYLNTNTGDQSKDEEQAKENQKEPENSLCVRVSEPAVEDSVNDAEDVLTVPPAKRMKLDDVCISCLGVLQEETWPEGFDMVQEVLQTKRYECDTIACALSSPICAILREHIITLHLAEAFPGYDSKSVMPLKEAWKWSFGRRLAARVDKQLDSGAVAPLLVTLTVEYPDDLQELEVLKSLAPALFESRSKQRRRFAVEFTRRVVEQALGRVTLAALRGLAPPAPRPPRAAAPARPVAAQAQRAPLYLAGRYLKLSRDLPQTPWLVAGRRMMDSSVQEIIFEPVAAAYGVPPDEAERCLKFMSAGREDVDVRCLGTGRPFALEISDPRRRPDDAELQRVCELIGLGGRVRVPRLLHIEREDLALLKKGEESKCKTYEALCIKLSHTDLDLATTNGAGDAAARRAPEVTERDIANINAYSNTAPGDPARVLLSQRTPVRVLHRRPLLTRARRIYALSARAVPGRPALFVVRLRTEAGTYVKEWAHGELRRTRPALGAALGASADILALDVADVDLPWPPAARL
ncbi:tRNA pseudouridine synthase Pus10-like isoform X2 [Anticarsia gemmatalis]|uniref:tRNA pseudouridine synthase Pus10-like isoform X2 n=1 Tax=Anticarsia gemmatalis TaxID=129554 RepID=UPI003F777BE5